jgi:hypothetical protein
MRRRRVEERRKECAAKQLKYADTRVGSGGGLGLCKNEPGQSRGSDPAIHTETDGKGVFRQERGWQSTVRRGCGCDLLWSVFFMRVDEVVEETCPASVRRSYLWPSRHGNRIQCPVAYESGLRMRGQGKKVRGWRDLL